MILLIEPDIVWQHRLQNVLQSISAIKIAENGQDAVERISNLDPFMIIMELQLPDMNWRRLYNHLAKYRGLSRMVAVTHENQLDEVTDAMNLGFSGYFHKPSLNLSELQSAITNLSNNF